MIGCSSDHFYLFGLWTFENAVFIWSRRSAAPPHPQLFPRGISYSADWLGRYACPTKAADRLKVLGKVWRCHAQGMWHDAIQAVYGWSRSWHGARNMQFEPRRREIKADRSSVFFGSQHHRLKLSISFSITSNWFSCSSEGPAFKNFSQFEVSGICPVFKLLQFLGLFYVFHLSSVQFSNQHGYHHCSSTCQGRDSVSWRL